MEMAISYCGTGILCLAITDLDGFVHRKPGPDPDYESLIGSNQRRLYEYIFSLVPNYSVVDDILQETNRVLWEKRDQFKLGTNFLAWARKIAHFQTLDFLKTSKRKGWLHFDTDLTQAIARRVDEQDETRVSRTKALKECMSKLSAKDQEIVNLRYNLHLSLKEIAVEASRSEGALKQVFLRIRKQLKECIDRKVLAAGEEPDMDSDAGSDE